MKDPIASARRAVATAQKRLDEQQQIVTDRRSQLRFAMARSGDGRSQTLINAAATFDAARVELDIRRRVFAKAHEHLARVLSQSSPAVRRKTIQGWGGTPTPQNRKNEEHMSNPRDRINNAIDEALYAAATSSEIARAQTMNPTQARKYLQLRAERRGQGSRGAKR